MLKRDLVIGALLNAATLFLAALLYQFALRPLVVNYEWAEFFGEPWFFGLEALILPIALFLRQRNSLAVGALIGVAVYFAVLPLAFIFGD